MNILSNGNLVVSAYSCSTTVIGSIITGVEVSGVIQTITATLATYNFCTTLYGVTFAASGTFFWNGYQKYRFNLIMNNYFN